MKLYDKNQENTTSILDVGHKKRRSKKKVIGAAAGIVLMIIPLVGCTAKTPEKVGKDPISTVAPKIEPVNIMKTFEVNSHESLTFDYLDGNYNKRKGVVDLYIKNIVFNGTIVNFEMNLTNTSPYDCEVYKNDALLSVQSNSGNMIDIPQGDKGGHNVYSKFTNTDLSINYFIANPTQFNLEKKMTVKIKVPLKLTGGPMASLEYNLNLNDPSGSAQTNK